MLEAFSAGGGVVGSESHLLDRCMLARSSAGGGVVGSESHVERLAVIPLELGGEMARLMLLVSFAFDALVDGNLRSMSVSGH